MFEDYKKAMTSAFMEVAKDNAKARWEFLRKTRVHWGGISSQSRIMLEEAYAGAEIEKINASARIAKAEADTAEAKAKIVEAEANSIVRCLTVETGGSEETMQSKFQRLPLHEQEKQIHKAQIIGKALGELSPDATEENIRNMDNDWLGYLFKQCDITSNEKMQSLWAKILAGEASKLGSFSKKTVSIVDAMDKTDAQMFTDFCQFVWHDESHAIPIIHDHTHDIYQTNNSMFDMFEHLSSIGLLSIAPLSGYVAEYTQPAIIMSYFGRQVHLTAIKKQGTMYTIDVGRSLMTQMGQQLASICGAQANDEFFQYIIDKWRADGLNPQLQES